MERKKKAPIILSVVSAVLLLNIVACFFVTKLVYDGVFARYEKEACEEFTVLCQSGKKACFYSGDNRLYSYLFDTEGESLVVVVLGINTQMSEHTSLVEGLIATGRDVFIFDMTGTGESEGESSVGFSQVYFDLNCALDYIEEEYDYEEVFLLGHSRGGFGAISVLSERDDVSAVLAVNAPNSAMEAVVGTSVQKLGGAAYANYPMLYLYQTIVFDRETVDLSCIEIIDDSTVPVLTVQGVNDEEILTGRYSVYSHRNETDREGAEFMEVEGDHCSAFEAESIVCIADGFFDKYTKEGGE